jgi:hypothetical protein
VISREVYDGGSPASGFERGVAKGGHEGCPGEETPDHFALYADAASMDDPKAAEAEAMGLGEIFLDHGLHVSRGEGVEVENIGDRDDNRFGVGFFHS